MSYRVEIAAAEESSSETRERQKRGLTTEYTEFHRESHDALAVEFGLRNIRFRQPRKLSGLAWIRK